MAESKFPYFCLGLGFGAVIGLMCTPKKGDELREDLRHHATEGRDFMRRRSDELRERAGDAFDRSRTSMHSQREQLAAALEAGRRAYREATREPASNDTETVSSP